jgi:hypothetical protein
MATDAAAVYTNFSGAFPNVVAVNATSPSATDGTEFIKAMIDNYMFGPQQALLDYASLTPDAVTEAAGTAQTIEAIQKGFAVGPGKYVWWGLNDTPATTGDRVILLTNGAKQGVLRATYDLLDAACYVGDGSNPTAPYFYRATDAAGTTRSTTGAYLILPPGKQLYEKQYSEAAGDFTVTGTNWTTSAAVATPYQTDDGEWRLIFNIAGTLTSSTTLLTLSISGITTKNVSGFLQSTSISVDVNTWAISRFNVNSNSVLINTGSASGGFRISGNITLNSEPTWTDGFNYKQGITY